MLCILRISHSRYLCELYIYIVYAYVYILHTYLCVHIIYILSTYAYILHAQHDTAAPGSLPRMYKGIIIIITSYIYMYINYQNIVCIKALLLPEHRTYIVVYLHMCRYYIHIMRTYYICR